MVWSGLALVWSGHGLALVVVWCWCWFGRDLVLVWFGRGLASLLRLVHRARTPSSPRSVTSRSSYDDPLRDVLGVWRHPRLLTTLSVPWHWKGWWSAPGGYGWLSARDDQRGGDRREGTSGVWRVRSFCLLALSTSDVWLSSFALASSRLSLYICVNWRPHKSANRCLRVDVFAMITSVILFTPLWKRYYSPTDCARSFLWRVFRGKRFVKWIWEIGQNAWQAIHWCGYYLISVE